MKNHKLYSILSFIFIICVLTACEKQDGESKLVIYEILPAEAGNGDTVTIVGRNFLTDGFVAATINNRTLKILKRNNDTIKIEIPRLLGSGKVLLNMSGEIYEGPEFTYKYKAIVSTIAGSGLVGKDDGDTERASFYCPWGITSDNNGDLYIADSYNRLIRKVSLASNSVSTIDIPTFIGDRNFYSPYNITFDRKKHQIYVTDFNENILKIDSTGKLSVIYKGTMPTTGIALGEDGYLYVSNNTLGSIFKLSTDGKEVIPFVSGLRTPRNIIFDKDNTMFVPAYNIPANSSGIYKIDKNGKPELVHSDADFKGWEIAIDSAGNFYEADHFNNRIRMINKAGEIVTLAGNGIAADVDGIGVNASFNGPRGIHIDQAGNIYVTTYNEDKKTGNKVRKIVVE